MLDHFAIGTDALADGWVLFGRLLGGRWTYGGNSPGYWWGQMTFARGPKVELLTPTGGPDAAFLERFLAARGPGAHHITFVVDDIRATLRRVETLGIQPVQVNLGDPSWKEAFLHPVDAHGIVVQIAEQAGPPPQSPPPAELREPGPASTFVAIEHHVADLDSAWRLFADVLDGRVHRERSGDAPSVDLTWDNGACLRLVRTSTPAGRETRASGGAVHHVEFQRRDGGFTGAERERARDLAQRLGVVVRLAP